MVIAIIGVLASVVLASLNSARAKARDTARMASIRQVKTALEMYYHDHNAYPYVCSTNLHSVPGLEPYISEIPRDPTFDTYATGGYGYCGVANAGGTGVAYGIRVRMENTERPDVNPQGFCKTGVNVWPGWWGSIPECSF